MGVAIAIAFLEPKLHMILKRPEIKSFGIAHSYLSKFIGYTFGTNFNFLRKKNYVNLAASSNASR